MRYFQVAFCCSGDGSYMSGRPKLAEGPEEQITFRGPLAVDLVAYPAA